MSNVLYRVLPPSQLEILLSPLDLKHNRFE